MMDHAGYPRLLARLIRHRSVLGLRFAARNYRVGALLAVINDILDFSKIEAGRLDLEQQPIDLRACVESAVDLLAPRAEEKGLDLIYAAAEEVPAGVLGDTARLRQILVNLLANAVTFTERGEVVVEVRLGDWGQLLFSVVARVTHAAGWSLPYAVREITDMMDSLSLLPRQVAFC